MPRARDPNRDKAKELYLESDGKMLLKDIAEQLGKSDSQIRKWKNQDKWDNHLKGNVTNQSKGNVTKQSGAPKGNKNAVGNRGNANPSSSFPKRNSTAEKHGFFSKFLPEETLEIMEAMNVRSPADLIWDQIQIQYAAIIRAQKIMNVTAKDEMIKELKKAKYDLIQKGKGDNATIERVATEEEYEFQFAWERQAQFLTAQSRAISELRTSIKQFIALVDEEDERKLKLEQMQLNVDKTKVEIDKLQNGDESTTQESEIAKMLRKMAGDE